jgi:hypothetical protein
MFFAQRAYNPYNQRVKLLIIQADSRSPFIRNFLISQIILIWELVVDYNRLLQVQMKYFQMAALAEIPEIDAIFIFLDRKASFWLHISILR